MTKQVLDATNVAHRTMKAGLGDPDQIQDMLSDQQELVGRSAQGISTLENTFCVFACCGRCGLLGPVC
jgi:hypothetical protein